VTLLFVVLGTLCYAMSGSVRFPAVVAVAMFGFMYMWNRLGPITFPYEFGWWHAAYLLSTLSVFSVAMATGTRSRRRRAAGGPSPEGRERRWTSAALVLMAIGVVGAGLFALDILRNLNVGAVSDAGILDDVRSQFWERTTGWMGAIGSFLMPAALPGIALGLRAWLKPHAKGWQRRCLLPLLLITVVSINATGILTGGRQLAFGTVTIILGVALYGGWKSFSILRRRLAVVGMSMAFVLAAAYFLAVITSRATGTASANRLVQLFQNDEADWFKPVSAYLPDQAYTWVVALSDYVPYDLTSLAIVIDHLDYSRLGWGRVQGVHVIRQLNKAGISFSPDFGILETSLFVNGPTGIGMMIEDFGLFGSILVYSWLGWLLGRQYGLWRYRHSVAGYLFCVVGFQWILQSHMSSPLQETFPFYGMLWSLCVAFVIRVSPRPGEARWSGGDHLLDESVRASR
jgi:hypothetical protein